MATDDPTRPIGAPARRDRRGQAMIEFIVAIVSILALFAGLMQLGLLGLVRTETMHEARRIAGVDAMADTLVAPLPDFLEDWTMGADQKSYSVDDTPVPGDIGDFQARMLSHARPVELGAHRPGNIVTHMANEPEPQIDFAFTHGQASEVVGLIPAVTHLLYAAPSIKVKSEAWLVWTKGVY